MSKIIGIGGVSRSGKTHLSHDIVWHYRQQGKRAIAIRQDDFVRLNDQIPTINEEINWEIPESIDYSLIIKALEFFSENFDILIIDGHLIYADKKLVNMIDVPFLLKTSEETFYRRKADDTRWGTIPKWFINHIWDAFKHYGAINIINPIIVETDYPGIDNIKQHLP